MAMMMIMISTIIRVAFELESHTTRSHEDIWVI